MADPATVEKVARAIRDGNNWTTLSAEQLALASIAAYEQAIKDAGMVVVPRETFQARVKSWMDACFGPVISADKLERNDRFIEEALELTQATGYTADRAHALVDYVFSRPVGDLNQEVGGSIVTLAAHCLAHCVAHGVNMHEAVETELARIWTKVEQIRAKQAGKPTGSALPIAMIAASEGLPAPDPTGWQPIETAPRDGTPVLLFAQLENPEAWAECMRDLPSFMCVGRWHPDAGWCVCTERVATHWRPLPAPPELEPK